MTFNVFNVSYIKRSSERFDLVQLYLGNMPCYILDDIQEKLDSLVRFFQWGMPDATISNTMAKLYIDVYNTTGVQLREDVLYKMEISVHGIHHDDRLGDKYVPILVLSSVVESSDETSPASPPASSPASPPASSLASSPASSPALSPASSPALSQHAASRPSIVTSGKRIWWDADDNQSSDLLTSDDDEPAAQRVKVEPVHDVCRHQMKGSHHLWNSASDSDREKYYKCDAHQRYVCPECLVHVDSWSTFVVEHHGCDAFKAGLKKKDACSMCV